MSVFNLEAILSLNSKQFEDGLKSAKGLAGSVGSAIGGGFKTLASVGAKALMGATTAVTGFAAASVKTGMDFDKAMSQVQATMLKTDEEMENEVGRVSTAYGEFEGNLREFAMFLGKNTKFSATEAAEALNYMALAGYDTQESLNMLPSVLSLASAGDFDLARASDMVTDAQTALGLSSERTALMVDEMAKAASSGNTSVEQLGDAFLVVGGLAQELNGGFVETASGAKIYADGLQEMEIALTAMANAGIKGSEGGTHMRNMLTKLSSPTAEGTKALEAMGVTIFDVEGNMRSLTDIMSDLGGALSTMTQEEKIQTISDLFNSRDLASAEALLGAVEQKYVKIGDDIMDMGSAYEKYGDAIYDSTQGFEIVQSSWDELGEKILDAKIPLEDVTKAIDDSGLAWEKYGLTAQDEIDELSASIRHDLSTSGLSVAETAANIAEAYDISLGDATKAVMNVDKALKEATGSAADMANIQLDNLDGDVTIFQSALESAKITVSNELTPALREFVQFGTQGLSDMVDAFNEGGLSGAMDKFGEILSAGIGKLTEGLPEVIDAGMQLLEALGKGIIDNAPVLFDALFEVSGMIGDRILELMEEVAAKLEDFDFAGEASKVMDYIVQSFNGGNFDQLLSVGLEIVMNIANGIVQALPAILQGAVGILQALVNGISQKLPTLIPAAVKMIAEIAKTLTEPNTLVKIVQSAVQLIIALAQGLVNAIPDLLRAVPIIIQNLLTAIIAAAPQLLAGAAALTSQLVLGLLSGIPELLMAGLELVTSIGGAIEDATEIIKENGAQLVAGLLKGISDAWSGFISSVERFINSFVDRVKNILGISSPSKVFAEIGKFLIQGLIDGIQDMMGNLKEKANDIVDAFSELPSKMLEVGGNIVEGLWKGISDGYGWITEKLSGWVDNVLAYLKNLFGIKSPSKVMRDEVGVWLGRGVAVGITDSLPDVTNAMDGLMDVVDAGQISTSNVVGYPYHIAHMDAKNEDIYTQNDMVDAFVKALDKYGLTVEIDNRELGRVVRREVLA